MKLSQFFSFCLLLFLCACNQQQDQQPDLSQDTAVVEEQQTTVTGDKYILYRPSPEDGGPRNWIITESVDSLVIRSEALENAPVAATYPSGTLLDNLGCQAQEEEIWCDVQPLGGGMRGYIEASLLQPAVSPDGSVSVGPDDSALRLGQGDVDATGTIPCSLRPGQPTFRCDFEVARAGGGYASLRVVGPDSHERIIFFRMGIPIGVSSSEASPVGPFSATKESDLNMIRVGEERYEVPDAVISGRIAKAAD